jgi:hypothetical protein
MPSVPIDKGLYNQIKKKIKARVKVWPSAYASGQLVREYKRQGGRYRKSSSFGLKRSRSGGLARWFKEEWVDVCRPRGRSFAKCGRKSSSRRNYPYCRPLRRISKSTPRTVREIGRKKLKQMCAKKRRYPYKIFNLNGKSFRRKSSRKVRLLHRNRLRR